MKTIKKIGLVIFGLVIGIPYLFLFDKKYRNIMLSDGIDLVEFCKYLWNDEGTK